MPHYTSPLRDMRFVYNELFDEAELRQLPGFDEVTPDLVDAMLEAAGDFCSERLLPLNRSGDEQGCRFDNGVVSTPEGFCQAYRDYCELGLSSLCADPDYGGQGLPAALGLMVEEMVCSTNLAFGLYPGLTSGACNALIAKASDALKQTWLPNMAAGHWSGTMCLTEPHCGTDLGLLRTKAEPQADGSYAISGTKIFITAGEHDLSDNIVHLVLARSTDAPKGIKGISLFLVPKFCLDENGQPARRNGVSCGSIEHKMGIKASATCVINFDAASGYLVGELNKGMAAMFVMMNNERLAVGVQGLGIAEIAYQNAAAYAATRLQGRASQTNKRGDGDADPILQHADVRRMLLTQRAYAEGGRALVAWIAREIDFAQRHPDAQRRQQADDLIAFLTPVIKAFLTDIGSECANLGVQVFGGHGYIREHGMEQYVRDARIAQIYEGTNGIQAMDLVGRKLLAGEGRCLAAFLQPIADDLHLLQDNAVLQAMMPAMQRALDQLRQASTFLQQQSTRCPDDAGAAATDYLRLTGLVALGYLWCRMAVLAAPHCDGAEARFYQAKVDTARFYFARLMPQCEALFAGVMAGSASLMEFNDEAFAR